MSFVCLLGTISCTKEGVKFSVAGDLGKGNVTVRNNTTAEKEEEQVRIQMEEPVTLTFALRYLGLFAKVKYLGDAAVVVPSLSAWECP